VHLIESGPLPSRPYECAVTHRADLPMFDLAVETSGMDQHLYLRPGVIEEAGKKLGMVSAGKYEALLRKCTELESRLGEVEKVASSVERFQDAAASISGLTPIKIDATKKKRASRKPAIKKTTRKVS
jgi:hypothetical protein